MTALTANTEYVTHKQQTQRQEKWKQMTPTALTLAHTHISVKQSDTVT